jgi:hypothetical protein
MAPPNPACTLSSLNPAIVSLSPPGLYTLSVQDSSSLKFNKPAIAHSASTTGTESIKKVILDHCTSIKPSM